MELRFSKRSSVTSFGSNVNQTSSRQVATTTHYPPNKSSSDGEWIRSTQSLVEKLQLSSEDIAIQSVHPSIIGQDTWFQITYTTSGTTRYFSCQSPKERDEWMQSLKKTLMLTEDRRRTENTLILDVQEVKGLTDKKKKYYVEILVDDKLYARTSSKKLSDQAWCFWGEKFEFKDLPQTDRISIFIHKDKGNPCGKKSKKPVGRLKISVSSVQSRYIQDKWYLIDKPSRRENPSIRLKCQYQSIEILPLKDYEAFLYFLKDEYKDLCKLLEPNISVKIKEELSGALMAVFHAEDMAEDVLADIVVDEISSIENEHLTFRGNSIATKAMECYIKLVGQTYLQETLQHLIRELLTDDLNLEIDPIKVSSAEVLFQHQQSLISVVRRVWSTIAQSHTHFPVQLRRCFHKIRQYLIHVGKPDLGDNLISSCIFLRYLCPSILAPSLFHLTDEYPSEKANRNLTLIAKTLQTLANFTRYEGKENSMEFLNSFLEGESEPMKNFLRRISAPTEEDEWIPNLSKPAEKSELSRHLSSLHTILSESISPICSNVKDSHAKEKASKLRQILDEINTHLHRPTFPELEKISQPTTKTLRQIRENNQSKTFAGITLPWLGTLPKKNKTNESVPAGASFSDTSTSSASVTPSPGTGSKLVRRTWPTIASPTSSSSSSPLVTVQTDPSTGIGIGVGVRESKNKSRLFASSISLDDTDSSDDSTYSSQYQSDAVSTPKMVSHTLPRHTSVSSASSRFLAPDVAQHRPALSTCAKSFLDYEQEILELRSAMEQLQMKLDEAEKKLQTLNYDPDEMNSQLKYEERARMIMDRLIKEEDLLRRKQMHTSSSSVSKMIMIQDKKMAILDKVQSQIEQQNGVGASPEKAVIAEASPKEPNSSCNVTLITTSSNTSAAHLRTATPTGPQEKLSTVIRCEPYRMPNQSDSNVFHCTDDFF